MRRDIKWAVIGAAAVALWILIAAWLMTQPSPAEARDPRPGCVYYEPVLPHEPTGVRGCELTGPTTGLASWYGGAVAAANWCVWPWDACGEVRIQAVSTGVTIWVPIGMYCDCYTGTAQERLVDLTRAQVLALGLDPAAGLFDVVVTPVREGASSATFLPNTAMLP